MWESVKELGKTWSFRKSRSVHFIVFALFLILNVKPHWSQDWELGFLMKFIPCVLNMNQFLSYCLGLYLNFVIGYFYFLIILHNIIHYTLHRWKLELKIVCTSNLNTTKASKLNILIGSATNIISDRSFYIS